MDDFLSGNMTWEGAEDKSKCFWFKAKFGRQKLLVTVYK